MQPSISAAQLNADFNPVDATVCLGAAHCFTDNTTGGTQPYTYLWNFGGLGTSTDKNPCWVFTTTGTYTVTLTVTDNVGAVNTESKTVKALKLPVANFSVSDPDICEGTNICFTDISVAGDAPINSWTWDFGSGPISTGQNPCNTYGTAGTYTVFFTIEDTNGCEDSYTLTNGIVVHDPPVPNFTTDKSISCTFPATIQFTDNSTAGAVNGGAPASWSWDFGDASPNGTGQTVSHTYNTPGSYIVDMTVTDQNGCTATVSKPILIDNYSINIAANDPEGCVPFTTYFTGTFNSVVGGKPSFWQWTFPGGTPGTQITTTNPPPANNTQTANIKFSSPGTYCVYVSAPNQYSCPATDTVCITVFPLPAVDFVADTTAACQDPFTVTFTDLTPGVVVSEIWCFDNWNPNNNTYNWCTDTTGDTVTNIYYADPNRCYNVSLIVTDTNGCIDTLVKDNYICVAEPEAKFTFDTLCGCAPFMVGFTDQSTMPPVLSNNDIVTWHWEFGDGWIIEGGDSSMPDSTNNCLTNCEYPNPTHTYVDTGMYDSIMLIITTALGCKDTTWSSTVDDPNDPDDCKPNQPFCSGKCGVGVGIPPNTFFYVDDTIGCFPFEVEFHNLSSTWSTQWDWDYDGDGTADATDEFAPTYTYSDEPDTFTVIMVSKMHDCTDTLVRENYIHVLSPKADFLVSSDFFDDAPYVFCYGDSQITGGWEITIKDTSYSADFWLFNLRDRFDTSATGDTLFYETIDTCIKIWDDTVFVEADTIHFDDTLIDFWTPVPADPVCNNYYWIYVDSTDTFIIADTIIPTDPPWVPDSQSTGPDTIDLGCDTLIIPFTIRTGYSQLVCMKGDTMFWVGMCDSAIDHEADTVKLEPWVEYTPRDTIIDTTYVIYTPRDTLITGDTSLSFCCDLVLYYPPETLMTYLDSIYTVFWEDTACKAHDSLRLIIDTTFIPCSITYVAHDLIDINADTIIIPTSATVDIFSGATQVGSYNISPVTPGDTVIINIPDDICISMTSYSLDSGSIWAVNFAWTDTYGVHLECTPADTQISITPPDTVLPDTVWHNCIYDITDTIFPVVDTTITPEKCDWRPRPFTHTYTQPGVDTITLIVRSSETECIDSITKYVIVCRIQPDFAFTPATSCEPVNVQFTDQTQSICTPTLRFWDFGDGCIVWTDQYAMDPITPIDNSDFLHVINCNNTVSGTYMNPKKYYGNDGVYNINLVMFDTYGCGDSIVKQVTVYPNPAPDFYGDTLSGCNGLEVHFCDTTFYNHPNDIVQWAWKYTNTGVNPNIIETHITSVPCDTEVFYVANPPQDEFKVEVQLTDINGCTGTATKINYVIVTDPVASMVFQNNWCDDKEITISGSSTLVTTPATFYWDFCDGEVDTTTTPTVTITHTFDVDSTDSTQICLVVEDINGCLDDTTMPIVIHDPHALLDTIMVQATYCPPLIITFIDTAKSTDDITSYTWYFGDNSPPLTTTDSFASHTYLTQGWYNVSHTIETSFGCKDSIFIDSLVHVTGPIFVDQGYIDTAFCAPVYNYAPATITLSLTVLNTCLIAIVWGDGATDSLPVSTTDTTTFTFIHSYSNNGVYTPVVYIWDPLTCEMLPLPFLTCGTQVMGPITVTGPVLNFQTDDTICGPREVFFANNSTGYQYVATWIWDYGDPYDPAKTYNFGGQHYYSTPGVYDVTLTALEIKSGDTCIYYTTREKYVTVFNFPYPPSEGCPPLEVIFEADTILNVIPLPVDDIVWTFGDSDSSNAIGDSVVHIYQATGDSIKYNYYTVTAKFTNGCKFTWDSLVTVYPVPKARFIMDALVDADKANISTITFLNYSGGDTIHQIYFWDFGDNDDETQYYPYRSVTHAYVDSGTFTVTLIVTDDITKCRDTAQQTITITIKVPNIFTPNGDGVNDYFNLDIPDGLLDLRLIVFNRWGIKVYESDNYPSDCGDDSPNKDRCWDGRNMQGKPLNNDTYYYVLNLEDKAVFNGWVMILREKK
ncbi:MAG: PKD domain-containing protein [Bacteroidetes bacterium]|nr:PKD domain-containing protein [Bacteroidota bacterium]